MFNLIQKHDDVTWALYHKDRRIVEASFDAIKSLMVDAYGFSLEEISTAVDVMNEHGYNNASFGAYKRFVVATLIEDVRAGLHGKA